jgi:hypothetical protein
MNEAPQKPLAEAAPAAQTAEGRSSTAAWLFSSISSFLSLAAKEWLPSLLDQPTTPPFRHDAPFNNEVSRISRLLAIVVIISGVLLGSLDLLAKDVNATSSIKAALMILAVAVVLGIIYKPFTKICGVCIFPPSGADQGVPAEKSLSLRQSVFSVIYILIPWLPLFAFVRAAVFIKGVEGSLLMFLLFVRLIFIAYILINFAKSIRMITNCPWYRIWLSLLLPVFLLLGYILIL